MKIVVYTLTRDRLWSTQHCLPLLREKAGVEFFHIVVDNGSRDGTQQWLERYYHPDCLLRLPENAGISRASNLVLDHVCADPGLRDALLVKVDNDCEVESDAILHRISQLYNTMGPLGPKYVLSPRVEGIVNQPHRGRYEQVNGMRIGLTAIVGGLFQCVPPEIYRVYRYPLNIPMAHGQDDDFCNWVKTHGGQVGYVEGLVVNHYLTTDGQCRKDRAYFERKHDEEITVPVLK